MSVRVLRVADAGGLARVRALRFEVFVTEQGVRAEEELDARDELPGTVHLLAVSDEAPEMDLGTARLLSDAAHPGVVHVTRVAVRADARRRRVGSALMAAIEELALGEFAAPAAGDGGLASVRVELSAQETAMPFYAALGYEIATERYLDARMWHRDAVKVLTRP